MESPITDSDSNSNSISNDDKDESLIIDDLQSNQPYSAPHNDKSESESQSSPGSTIRRRRIADSEPTESSALFRATSYRLQSQEESEQHESTQTQQAPNNGSSELEEEGSDVSTAINDGPVGDLARSHEFGESSSNLLDLTDGFVVRALGFQLNLISAFITFPSWLLSKSYMFAMDPIGTTRNGRDYAREESLRVYNLITDSVDSYVHDWLGEDKSIWDLFRRYGWGLLWAAFVCFLLFGILVSSFLVGAIWMHYLVEEPIHINEALNFDYTMHSPLAFVPVTSCAKVGCGLRCQETSEVQKGRGFHNRHKGSHKWHASITLVLPESEYNRKLGMFQARVDFLSADGTTISSSSQLCMLQFRSEPIRLFSTFLKAAPLLAGYSAESQTLKLKFRSFIEGTVPTACLKVIIEQRAEYRPGAGIPELYDASLYLESELPPFRRFIWRWKRTIFVWISIMSLLMELLLAVVFCRPYIIPQSRMWFASDEDTGTENSIYH